MVGPNKKKTHLMIKVACGRFNGDRGTESAAGREGKDERVGRGDSEMPRYLIQAGKTNS